MATRVETVFCFGDSNAAGCGATGRRGWLQRMGELYYDLNGDNARSQQMANVYHLAFPGATAETFLNQVQSGEASLRYRPGKETLSVVAVGAQDISVNLDNTGPREVGTYIKYMANAVGELLALGDVLYVGIPSPDWPFVERAVRQKGFDGDVRDIVSAYESTTAELVATMAAHAGRRYGVVPLLDLTAMDPQYAVSIDHIHPDNNGHDVIYGLVEPVFKDMVEL